jgi:hypothetical protein
MCEIAEVDDSYRVEYVTYPVGEFDIGSMVRPIISDDTPHYLSSGTADVFDLTESELRDFFSLENIPVLIDGELCWSESLSLDSV